MGAQVLLAAILCLIGCELAGCCGNYSEDSLGLSMLTKYNLSLDAESILKGDMYQLGRFEDCINMKEKQYCMATINLYPNGKASPFWDMIQEKMKLRTNIRRDRLFVGLCVRVSCNTSNIEDALFDKLKPGATALGIQVNVSVAPQNCQSKQPFMFTTADYIVGATVLIIIMTVLGATLYEGVMRILNEEKKGINLVLGFSLITNWKRLSSPPAFKPLRIIQTIRVVSLYFILLGHEIFIMLLAGVENLEWFELSYQDISRTLFFNGHLIVSTYFVISGYLLGYMGTEGFIKHGFSFFGYISIIFFRYIRLTPAYAVILGLSATWFRYLGSGPFWHSIYGIEVENCRNYWWLNMLYINNYVHGDKPCLQHGWYLAADFQNFAVAILVLALVNKYRKWDKVIFTVTFFLCMLVPAVQTYMERLDPMLLTYPDTIRDVINDRTYLRSYLTFHHNAVSYFMGVITGYIYYKTSTYGIIFPKPVIAILWVVALTVPWSLLFVGYIFYLPSYEYNVISASIYSGTYKAAFSFGIGIILLGCSSGYGWIFNTLATWKPAQILGRLTYCAFLVHLCVIRIELASEKHLLNISEYFLAQRSASDFVISFLLGCVLCLFVEMPSSAILKIIINAAKAKASDNTRSHNEKNAVEMARQTYKKEPEADMLNGYNHNGIATIHISKSG